MRSTSIARRALAIAVAGLACAAGPAAGASGPGTVRVASACFQAHGPDRKAYTISGRRYATAKTTRSTPAILLVHGVGSSAATWDLTPRWSVARRLARAGFLVVAYDRLGYRHSRYGGAGSELTVDAQQRVLHEMVGALHSGAYRVGRARGTCAQGRTRRSAVPSRDVALIGHSAGGFIVSSYPGRYHDVVAMVQANAPSGLSSTDPPGNAALLSAGAPPARGSMAETYGPIGDAWTDGARPPLPGPGYAFDFATRTVCEDFNLWRPGTVKDAATPLCDPANAIATPAGESASFVDQAIANTPLIQQTGDIPVLLAAADHDGIMPGDANALELSAWREHCGCDVSQFVLEGTGHAFMAHWTLRRWTIEVVRWLREHDLRHR